MQLVFTSLVFCSVGECIPSIGEAPPQLSRTSYPIDVLHLLSASPRRHGDRR